MKDRFKKVDTITDLFEVTISPPTKLSECEAKEFDLRLVIHNAWFGRRTATFYKT